MNALAAREVEGFQDSQDILQHGQPAEIAAFLGEVSDSKAGAFEHGQKGDIDRVECDGAAVRLDHAEDHAEGGGFPRPVAAQEADDLTLTDQKADVVDNRPPAI